jgi:hypothetical protein
VAAQQRLELLERSVNAPGRRVRADQPVMHVVRRRHAALHGLFVECERRRDVASGLGGTDCAAV